MARFTLKTRHHGGVEFVCNDSPGYVRVYLNERPARQICEGGGFMGETIIASGDRLEAKARKWWNQYLRREREVA